MDALQAQGRRGIKPERTAGLTLIAQACLMANDGGTLDLWP